MKAKLFDTHALFEEYFNRVFENLWLRKLYHIGGGALMAHVLFAWDMNWIFAFIISYLVIFKLLSKRLSFAIVGILILLAVSHSRFITLASYLIFVVGDGMAAVFGTAFGRMNWPWHSKKTIVGSLACLVSALLVMSNLVNMLDLLSPWHRLAVVFWPSLGATIIETLPISYFQKRQTENRTDDNLMMILGTGTIIYTIFVWLAI